MRNDAGLNIRGLQERLADAADEIAAPDTNSRQDKSPDLMLAALVAVAHHHHLPVEGPELISGITPNLDSGSDGHLHEAGRRAGLFVDRRGIKVGKLQSHHCPVIARFNNGSVGLITDISNRGKATIEIMGRPGEVFTLARSRLKRRIARVYVIRPLSEADAQSRNDMHSAFSWRVLSENAGLFTQAILATIAINLLSLAIPLFTMNVYDRVLPSNAVNTLLALGCGALIAIAFDFLLKTLRGVIVDTATRRSDVRLSNVLMHRIVGAQAIGQSKPVGVQMNTMREMETLRDFYTSATLMVFGDLPFVLLFLAVIWLVAGSLVIVPIVAIVMVLVSVFIAQKPLGWLMPEIFSRMSNKSAVLAESLNGLETIKSTGSQSWALARLERAVADQLSLGTKVKFFSSLAVNLAGLWQGLAVVAVITLGVGLVKEGAISAGAVIAAVLLLSRAMSPVVQLAALAGRMHQVSIAKQALMDVMRAPQERGSGPQLISRAGLQGEIRFDGVDFTYSEDALPALSNVTFHIRPGERIGIIGSIGSGKSTVLKLLMKSHAADKGLIRIDQVGIAGLDPYSLRSNIGYLSQDAALFRTTIRENIVLHNADISDQDLVQAAHNAGSLSWINRLPSGFDTMLGERGEGLSGGQKRSLALTRALAGRPDILLLDEPTSEVDGQTEMQIVKHLGAAIGNRTLVLVTHKPATLELVDRLIVMDAGKVMIDGPKKDVLAKLATQHKATTASRTKKANVA